MKDQYYNGIIVHPGGAHEDDYMAACLAVAVNGLNSYVMRKEPKPEDLAAKDILVLDVGRQHNPKLLNFDHHQMDPKVGAHCALSLYVDHLGLLDVFSVQRWWAAFVLNDCAGPFAVANMLGLPKYPFELESPLARRALRHFEVYNEVTPSCHLYEEMLRTGKELLAMATEFSDRYNYLLGAGETVSLAGVQGVKVDEVLSNQDIYDVAQTLKDQGLWGEHQFLMSYSQRGAGWDLMRFNDSPQVDFRNVKDSPGFDFVHGVGFFAQTTSRLNEEELEALVKNAMLPDKEPN